MGRTYAENGINSGVKIIVDVINQATQNCTTSIIENQSFVISGNDGGSIYAGDIDWSQVISIDLNCTQQSASQNSISNSVSQVVSQVAKATTSAFGVPGSSAKAKNNVNLWDNITTSIVNSYNQTCKNRLAQNQSVVIKGNNDENVFIGSVDWSQNVDALINCIQTDSSVNSVTNKLVQNIEQEATAIVEGILGPLFMILAIIIVVVLVIFLGGAKVATSPAFIFGLIFFVTAFFGIAYYRKWWPFNKDTPPAPSST